MRPAGMVVLVAIPLVGAAVVLAGCTPEAGQPTTAGTVTRSTSSAAPVATPTRSAAERAAAVDATKAYLSLQDEFLKAAANGDLNVSGVARYSIDKARADLQGFLFTLHQEGVIQVVEGAEPSHSPVVTAVKLNGNPPQVELRDCVDARSVHSIFRETGKSAEPTGAPYQPHRKHPAKATVELYSGRWLVSSLVTDQKATC